MSQVAKEYVAHTPEGSWRLAGTRVSLDSIVHLYRDGFSPEAMAAEFPSLSLEQIHGAIAFYLGHRTEIDDYLAVQMQRWAQLREEGRDKRPAVLERLRTMREQAAAEGPK